MSRMEEPNDRYARILSALLTVRSHGRGDPCAQCGIDGCPQWEWAKEVLAEYKKTRDE